MSQYLNNLKIGETIDVRGPSGKLVYLGDGKLSVKNLRTAPPTVVKATHINMIAGLNFCWQPFMIYFLLPQEELESRQCFS